MGIYELKLKISPLVYSWAAPPEVGSRDPSEIRSDPKSASYN